MEFLQPLTQEECKIIYNVIIKNKVKIGTIVRDRDTKELYQIHKLICGFGVYNLYLELLPITATDFVYTTRIRVENLYKYYEGTGARTENNICIANRKEFNIVIAHVKLRVKIKVGSIIKSKDGAISLVITKDEKTNRVDLLTLKSLTTLISEQIKDCQDVQIFLSNCKIADLIKTDTRYIGTYKNVSEIPIFVAKLRLLKRIG